MTKSTGANVGIDPRALPYLKRALVRRHGRIPRICKECLRRRWLDGENWPFPNDWKTGEKEQEQTEQEHKR